MNNTAIDGVLTAPLATNRDERGTLTELYRTDWADVDPAMAYLSITLPGVERGPHEHRGQTDVMAFPGPGSFRLRLADARRDSRTYGVDFTIDVGDGNPSVWVIPPGVMHGYRNAGEKPALSVNLPDRLYRGYDRTIPADEIRHEDDGLSMASERWVR